MFGNKKTNPVSTNKPGEFVRKTGKFRHRKPDPNDWTDKRNYEPELARKNTKMLPVKVTGTILILLTAGAVVVTSRSAMTTFSRESDNHLTAVAQTIADRDASASASQRKPSAGKDSNGSVKAYDFTTDQLDWAHKNHIRWDDYGNPVDESGKVVDDPTTDVNEIDRAEQAGTIDAEGKSKKGETAKTPDDIISSQKPAPTPVLSTPQPSEKPAEDGASESTKQASSDGGYRGNPKITHDSDGKYRYHIVWGDTLSKIAAETGCDVNALAQLNGIPDPNLIITGHVIMLPAPSGTQQASGSAGGSAPVTQGQSGNGLG